MLAPVVIFVYNRPEHTIRTIESLAQNTLAKETDVFVFSDGPKNKESKKKVDEVRAYLNSKEVSGLFKSITIEESTTNKGLANSVIQGVTKILSKYETVIVLEDDLESAPDFLSFMNNSLTFYCDSKVIWSICGYTFNLKIPSDYNYDIYFSYRAGSWGWATWKDRWVNIDWNVGDYDQFKKNKKLRRKFNRGGRDMSNLLDSQMEGKIDSWAIRWGYEQFKQDKLTVYPVHSRIRNIGQDGSGTHSGTTSRFEVNLVTNIYSKCEFVSPIIDERIIRNFRNYYSPPGKYYLVKILKNLKLLQFAINLKKRIRKIIKV